MSSDNWLDKADYVPYAPDEAGESVNVHHCKSGRGNDKLYIKRSDDGTNAIVAFCHHCSKKGYHNASKATRSLSKPSASTPTYTPTIPSDIINTWGAISKEGQDWLLSLGITEDIAIKCNIGYSNTMRRVILSYYDSDMQCIGVLARDIQTKTRLKWLLLEEAKGTLEVLYRRVDNERSDTLVIVEDAISAIRCSEFHDTLALLGTTLKPLHYASITKYDHFILFLDHDNSIVKMKEVAIIKTLRSLGTVEHVIAAKDPKEYNSTELGGLLNDY